MTSPKPDAEVTKDDLTQAGCRGDQRWPHPSRMPRWPKMTSPKHTT